ncbi:MAG: Ig-like domain-containing protein, partial [Gemmatimonadota bacterium]
MRAPTRATDRRPPALRGGIRVPTVSFRLATIRAPLLLAVLLTGGCDLFGPDTGPPSELQLSSMPGEMVVGEAVDLTVTVQDEEDRAVTGAAVSWTPTAGTVTAGSSDTDDDGTARNRWTLGTVAGRQTLAVRV